MTVSNDSEIPNDEDVDEAINVCQDALDTGVVPGIDFSLSVVLEELRRVRAELNRYQTLEADHLFQE